MHIPRHARRTEGFPRRSRIFIGVIGFVTVVILGSVANHGDTFSCAATAEEPTGSATVTDGVTSIPGNSPQHQGIDRKKAIPFPLPSVDPPSKDKSNRDVPRSDARP